MSMSCLSRHCCDCSACCCTSSCWSCCLCSASHSCAPLQGCGAEGTEQWHQLSSLLLLLRGSARHLCQTEGTAPGDTFPHWHRSLLARRQSEPFWCLRGASTTGNCLLASDSNVLYRPPLQSRHAGYSLECSLMSTSVFAGGEEAGCRAGSQAGAAQHSHACPSSFSAAAGGLMAVLGKADT